MSNQRLPIDFYLEELQKKYQSANLEKQTLVIGKLEALLEELDRPNPLSIPNFDGMRARRIRQEAGLTVSDLIKRLGFANPRSARVLIGEYEKGARVSVPRRTENSQKYLQWLKGQGYNPYNL